MAFNAKLLDGMVIFVEVVNSGSFTKAALNSGHSTSYISKEINKLEARLGVRLLNRTTRSISRTQEGELYFQQCQQIINDAEQAENTLSGRQLQPKGNLRVSCPVSFGLSRIRPVLADFIAKYPHVNLEIDLNDRKVDIVADGFDVVIRASIQLEDSSLISRRFMTSHSLTLASPDYLAKYGTPQHPRDLEQHKTISYSNLKQATQWTYPTHNEGNVQVKVNSRVLTNSPELELALALAGQGICRMPKFNLKDEIESGKLVSLFDDFPATKVSVYLVYPSRKYMSSKVRSFIDFVIQSLGD